MKYVIAIVLVAVSLAACNKAPSHGSGTPFRGGEAAVSGPQRKPGLWEQSVQRERGRTVVTQACFDAASDRRFPILPRQPRRAGACAKFDFSRSGNDYVVDSDCSPRGAAGPRMMNHEVIGGDFNASYTATSNLTVQNAPNPARNGAHSVTLTATYKGACPPDIAAGQTKLPDGQVIATGQVRRGWGGIPMGQIKPAGAGQLGDGQGVNGFGQGGGQGRSNGGANRGSGAGQGSAPGAGGADSPDDDGGQ